MKSRITLTAVGLFNIALFVKADDLPVKLSFDRYNSILEHSPFAVATAVVAPAATPNFAKDLYIANAAKSPDGDMITIASMTDRDFKKYLTTKAPVEGYAIASIDWSDDIGKTKATISKDGQYATLGFNESEMAKPMANRPIQAPVAPFQQPPNYQRPVGLPAPSPHVRGMIQRNPQNPATPNSAAQD